MKLLLTVAIMLIPAIADAQQYTNSQPSMNEPNSSTFASSVFGQDPFAPPETEAVRAEKLARAIALRDEAVVLQVQDGGKLSRKSLNYLRRKAYAILAYR
jgi:hypothetical protein